MFTCVKHVEEVRECFRGGVWKHQCGHLKGLCSVQVRQVVSGTMKVLQVIVPVLAGCLQVLAGTILTGCLWVLAGTIWALVGYTTVVVQVLAGTKLSQVHKICDAGTSCSQVH